MTAITPWGAKTVYISSMTVSSILQTAFSGLRASARQATTVAENVVNANTPGYQAGETRTTSLVTSQGQGQARGAGVRTEVHAGEAGVDLGREFANLLIAETTYRANAQVIREAEEQNDRLLDIVG